MLCIFSFRGKSFSDNKTEQDQQYHRSVYTTGILKGAVNGLTYLMLLKVGVKMHL